MGKSSFNNRGKQLSPAISMMKSPLYVLAALAGVLMQNASSETISAVDKEGNSETERIIGGKPAALGQFPYAVALFLNGTYACTASIIGPTTVLTAAHCVVFNGVTAPASDFSGIANVRKSSPSVNITFVSVTPHTEFSALQLKNDIAILKTNGTIPFSDTVGPICIAASGTQPMQYPNATAMGWGDNTRLRIFRPDILQYVDQTIISNDECRYSYIFKIEDNKICGRKFLKGVCNGDSGGPLVHLSADNVPIQLGVASYANTIPGCATIFASVWTRVSSFNDFIMEQATGDTICTV